MAAAGGQIRHYQINRLGGAGWRQAAGEQDQAMTVVGGEPTASEQGGRQAVLTSDAALSQLCVGDWVRTCSYMSWG